MKIPQQIINACELIYALFGKAWNWLRNGLINIKNRIKNFFNTEKSIEKEGNKENAIDILSNKIQELSKKYGEMEVRYSEIADRLIQKENTIDILSNKIQELSKKYGEMEIRYSKIEDSLIQFDNFERNFLSTLAIRILESYFEFAGASNRPPGDEDNEEYFIKLSTSAISALNHIILSIASINILQYEDRKIDLYLPIAEDIISILYTISSKFTETEFSTNPLAPALERASILEGMLQSLGCSTKNLPFEDTNLNDDTDISLSEFDNDHSQLALEGDKCNAKKGYFHIASPLKTHSEILNLEDVYLDKPIKQNTMPRRSIT